MKKKCHICKKTFDSTKTTQKELCPKCKCSFKKNPITIKNDYYFKWYYISSKLQDLVNDGNFEQEYLNARRRFLRRDTSEGVAIANGYKLIVKFPTTQGNIYFIADKDLIIMLESEYREMHGKAPYFVKTPPLFEKNYNIKTETENNIDIKELDRRLP